jgi:hypothetical protein
MKHYTVLFGLIVWSGSAARAADPVSWDDLPAKIGHGKAVFSIDFDGNSQREDRAFTVVTTAGEKVHLNSMGIDNTHLWGDGFDIPREQVDEVRIRHKGSFNEVITQSVEGGLFVCNHLGKACEHAAVFIAVIPVAVAYGIVSTIPCLAIEGIRRLLPAKTIKVAR